MTLNKCSHKIEWILFFLIVISLITAFKVFLNPHTVEVESIKDVSFGSLMGLEEINILPHGVELICTKEVKIIRFDNLASSPVYVKAASGNCAYKGTKKIWVLGFS